MNTIDNKQEFKRLSELGVLGNRFRTFRTVDTALASGVPLFYIRGPYAGWPHMVPWCPREELVSTVRRIKAKGGRGMQFIEVVKEPRTINAEITHSPHGLVLNWATSSTLDLRNDLARNGKHDFGLRALHVLQQRVPPEDIEMIFDLLDDWPGAIIEFSTYCRSVGIYDRPTIIWEVRHY